MPVVLANRQRLLAALEKNYTESEFDNLCFEFGIEFDGVTSEAEIIKKEQGADSESLKQASEEKLYKIEIPANRYDLLCEEGLFRALRIFTQKASPPNFVVAPPTVTLSVKAETAKIRPVVVAAILRNVTLSAISFDSFIKLQDKLHQNICRKRTLVSIGTHDLDALKAPFSYEAKKPSDIKFVPLKPADKEYKADELMELYETTKNDKIKYLKPFVSIIKDSDVYPVIYDSAGTVLSLPPIINGIKSAMSSNTKNVLIECTATDNTKANVVLNTIVAMFSQYCATPFSVEAVNIEYFDGRKVVTPNMESNEFTIGLDYINARVGINITSEQVAKLLTRMQLNVKNATATSLTVVAPPTRSDILHACDIMEDVAIAFGINNIPRTSAKTSTVGKKDPLNNLTDLLRLELANSGYTEVLTLILCSLDDIFKKMRKVDDGKTAVKIANPKTEYFQCCRTSLIPGLLSSVYHNLSYGVPLEIFEISDIVLKDTTKDVGARNVRRLAALYVGKTSGLEYIHGVLDRIMEVLEIPYNDAKIGYTIAPSNDESFFPGRQADIFLRGQKIGNFGVIHPEVLEAFQIKGNPVSVIEIDIEPLLQ